MGVFIAESGSYENRGVTGIYDSAERAMADNPGRVWTKTIWTDYPDWPKTDTVRHWTSWENDLGSDDACTISEMEITSSGPLRKVDKSVVQTLNHNGGWDYVEAAA